MIELLAALVLFAQGPSAGTPTEGSAAEAPKSDAKAKDSSKADKLVCRQEQVVGSRFPKRICVSAQDSAARRQDDQDAVRHMQDMTPMNSH